MAAANYGLPEEDRSDIRPDIPELRALEGGGASGAPRRGHLRETSEHHPSGEGGFYNPLGDDDDGPSTSSPDTLRAAEGRSLYNASGDRSSRLQKIKSGFGKFSSNKWLLGGVLGGSSLIAIIVIILIIIAGAYKVVDFAEHVAAYQFARVTGQMAENTANISSEKLGLEAVTDDSAGNALLNSFKARAAAVQGKANDLLSKLDQYRPGKVIDNYQGNGTLKLNYRSGKFGRQILDSATINGEDIGIKSSFASNHIPGLKFSRDFTFSKDFAPNLVKAMQADGIGPITRARVASQIRQELNVGLIAWATGRYAGKDNAAAEAEVERESTAVAEGEQLTLFDSSDGANTEPKVATGASSGVDQAASDVEKKLNQTVASDQGIKDIVNAPNQTPKPVADALANDASSTAITGLQGTIGDILGFINPVYKWGVPLCLIYDGSLQQSGPTIDQQSNQLEREAIWTQAAASQEKDGYNTNGEAVGATDWKLGDITTSNAEKRASGLATDTNTTLSTEASPTGQYTYSVADYIPGIGSVVDQLSPRVCSVLTNVYVGVGVGVASLGVQALLGIFSGGSADVAEAGGEAAMDAAINEQLSLFDASTAGEAGASSPSLLSRVMTRASSAGSYAKDFAKSTAKQVATIGAFTLLAKQLVVAQMGGSHSPTATGESFDNGADAGTNSYAGQIEQRQFYGAPMQDKELGSDNSANQAQLSRENGQKSLYERYASLDNPDSLLSRAAIMTAGAVNMSVFHSILSSIGTLLSNPIRTLGDTFGFLFARTTFADATITSNNTYYGNVQFGFTPEEKHIMDSDQSYALVENQEVLDQSGKEDTISSIYGQCFTESIGKMLASGDLKRDKNGGVLADNSLCSPKSLGPHNPTYGDLVFRWRVAQGYSNTLDQLICEQDTTTSCDGSASAASPSNSNATSAASGNAQQLAQQILGSKNVDLSCLSSSVSQDVRDAAAGKPGTAGAQISSAVLQLIATVGQGHKVCVTAIESNGQGHTTGSYHYTGDAVDFGSLDGRSLTGRDSGSLTIMKIAEGMLPSGSAFGQSQCGTTPPLPAGFSDFADTCNHLHVQVPRGTP